MKRFKEYKQKPIVIKAAPVHGCHATKALNESSPIVPVQATIPHVWYEKHDNDHIASNVNGVNDKLKTHINNDHLSDYTHYSRDTNLELIHKAAGKPSIFDDEDYFHKDEREIKKAKFHETVKGLDHLIDNHKPLEHDLHVYHGTQQWHPGKEAAKHSDGHVHLPGYTSTSISKDRANYFSGRGAPWAEEKAGSHILHIHLKKGQKGVYVGHNTSADENEHEFLLPRGTTLKIHPKPIKLTNYHKDGAGKLHPRHVHVWHAEPV